MTRTTFSSRYRSPFSELVLLGSQSRQYISCQVSFIIIVINMPIFQCIHPLTRLVNSEGCLLSIFQIKSPSFYLLSDFHSHFNQSPVIPASSPIDTSPIPLTDVRLGRVGRTIMMMMKHIIVVHEVIILMGSQQQQQWSTQPRQQHLAEGWEPFLHFTANDVDR